MANTKVSSEQIIDDVALAGSPTTTTQSASDNSTKVATTAYVTTAVANLVDSAPSSLNTLNELAAALNDNASFFSTVLPLSGGTMTGTLNVTGDGEDIIVSSADYELLLIGNRGSSGANLDKAYIRMKSEGTNAIVLDADGGSYLSGGNVGIGQTVGGTIDELLHLEKTSGTTIVKTEVAANSTVGFEIQKTGSTTSNWRIVDGQTVNGSLEIYDVTDSRQVMVFDGDGDIGMGVTPATHAKLTIGGTTASYSSVLAFDNNTTGGATFFMLASDNTWNAGGNKFLMGHGSPSSSAVDLSIDSDGNLTVGSPTYGSSLGQVRIINDAASAPASLSLFGYNNISDGTEFAKIDFASQISGTGGNPTAKIAAKIVGANERAADLTFSTHNDGGSLTQRMVIDSNGKIAVGNNLPIWSGAYGGAIFLKGNNSTSDRHARICIVDSTGSAINDGLTVNNSGSVTINSDQTYGLEVSGTGSGLRFTQGSNQRIYFNTHRALEGNSDGSILQIGEGYTQALVQAREKYSVDGATYGRVIIRFNATTTGDKLTAVTANLNTLLGLSTSDYGQWTVEFGGYAGSGTNGCTGSFTIGGYTGHNYSATNYQSYGAGTINVGYSSSGGASTGAGPLSYHPVQNNGIYIASGEIWVYVPAAQQVGIMIKNTGSQNMAGTMTVTATVRG